MGSRRLVVVDIDGVIADVRHRLHYLEGRRRDWDGFFAAAPEDPPLAEGRSEIERALADGLTVVYLTGRPERCRASTDTWLAQHGFPSAPLHMRGDQDRRPARVFKVDVLRDLGDTSEVVRVIDDDEAVVRAIRDAGFTVVHATWMHADEAGQGALFEAQESLGRT